MIKNKKYLLETRRKNTQFGSVVSFKIEVVEVGDHGFIIQEIGTDHTQYISKYILFNAYDINEIK